MKPPMSLPDAKAAVLKGTPVGDVYPRLVEEDGDALREWFVAEPGVPALASRKRPEMTRITAQQLGYCGDVCTKCGGVRMTAVGGCTRCEDCGATGGCG